MGATEAVAVERGTGEGGLARLALRAGGAAADVYLHGAHVARWATPDGRERLYLSPNARWGGDEAIRGGIPVIFPQFADRGPLPRHGFARTRSWTVMDAGADGDAAVAVLALDDDARTRAAWPRRFAATLTVRLEAGALDVALSVSNTGDASFDFTAALHSYLRVGDVRDAALAGLRGVRYLDQAAGGAERVDGDDVVRVAAEVDRVYAGAPPRLVLREGGRDLLHVLAAGFDDVVVWNPWAAKAALLADLGAGEELHMLCVEAAAAARPVTLAPGAPWTGRQQLIAR